MAALTYKERKLEDLHKKLETVRKKLIDNAHRLKQAEVAQALQCRTPADAAYHAQQSVNALTALLRRQAHNADKVRAQQEGRGRTTRQQGTPEKRQQARFKACVNSAEESLAKICNKACYGAKHHHMHLLGHSGGVGQLTSHFQSLCTELLYRITEYEHQHYLQQKPLPVTPQNFKKDMFDKRNRRVASLNAITQLLGFYMKSPLTQEQHVRDAIAMAGQPLVALKEDAPLPVIDASDITLQPLTEASEYYYAAYKAYIDKKNGKDRTAIIQTYETVSNAVVSIAFRRCVMVLYQVLHEQVFGNPGAHVMPHRNNEVVYTKDGYEAFTTMAQHLDTLCALVENTDGQQRKHYLFIDLWEAMQHFTAGIAHVWQNNVQKRSQRAIDGVVLPVEPPLNLEMNLLETCLPHEGENHQEVNAAAPAEDTTNASSPVLEE